MRAALRILLPLFVCLPLCACAGHSGPSPVDRDDARFAAAHEALADLQLRAGRTDLAAASYAKSLALRPDAGVLAKQGRALLRLGRPEPALESFQQVLASNPEDAGALAGAGESLLRLGRAAEALPALDRSLALSSASWRARCLRGLALEALGRPAEAVDEYLAALALPVPRASRLDLLNNLGVAQAGAGDVEAGVSTLQAALRLAAQGPGTLGHVPVNPAGAAITERTANNLGLLLARQGRHGEALAAFRSAGDDARALNNLGCALLLRGEAGKARLLFQKALDASPSYYEAAGENLSRASLAAGEGGPELRVPSRRAPLTLLDAPRASLYR